ncbi:MAG: YceI family protein [Flavobacteriales bacterium]|nr:YceI family protein [Flavobacteriales bacterium]
MGEASFSFTTKMGEVQAANHTATSMFDPNDGSIELSMLMKAFEFEKAAMQDQFNNELMESDAWPKAVFTGRLLGISDGVFSKPRKLSFLVVGNLTIHGTTRKVLEHTSWVVGEDGVLHTECRIKVVMDDYGITVPTLFKDVLPKEVELYLALDFEKL